MANECFHDLSIFLGLRFTCQASSSIVIFPAAQAHEFATARRSWIFEFGLIVLAQPGRTCLGSQWVPCLAGNEDGTPEIHSDPEASPGHPGFAVVDFDHRLCFNIG